MISRLLSFKRGEVNGAKVSDVKLNPGGGPNLTAQHFAPAGDDSFPLKTDYVYSGRVPGTGRAVALGYVDPLNTPSALEGDKRIYARDPADGSVIAQVWLKNTGEVLTSNANGSVTLGADGSITGQNANGQFQLQAGGNFVVNGATIDTTGAITSPTSVSAPSVVVNGKELDGHVHSGVTPGGSNTGPNV